MAQVKLKAKQKAVMWGTRVPIHYFGLVPGIIRATGESFIKSLASDSVNTIKKKIVHQTWNHKPLTPNYLLWKRKKGYDLRILIRTRFFLDNITSFNESRKDSIVYRVGVRTTKYFDGKELQTIARYLEYGTSRMPARPIFRPMSQEISAKINTHILRLSGMLNYNLAKKLPQVPYSQLLARAMKQGDSELVRERKVFMQGVIAKHYVKPTV